MTADSLQGLAAGFAHPLAGLDHLLAMFAVGVWAAQLGGRALWAVPATFVGSMAAGGLLGFAGLHPPLAEPIIAASVLALGLLIAFAVQRKAPGVVLIALFALFHGVAHALGIPHHDSAAGYAIGFLAPTVFLHVAGVGLGLALRSRARFAGAPLALAGGVAGAAGAGGFSARRPGGPRCHICASGARPFAGSADSPNRATSSRAPLGWLGGGVVVRTPSPNPGVSLNFRQLTRAQFHC